MGCGRVQEKMKRRMGSRYDLNALHTYMKLQKNTFKKFNLLTGLIGFCKDITMRISDFPGGWGGGEQALRFFQAGLGDVALGHSTCYDIFTTTLEARDPGFLSVRRELGSQDTCYLPRDALLGSNCCSSVITSQQRDR